MLIIVVLMGGESLGVGVNVMKHGYGSLSGCVVVVIESPPFSLEANELDVRIDCEDFLGVII